MDSKNYTFVPPQTEAWFDELSTWLGAPANWRKRGKRRLRWKGFPYLLFELIENMSGGIVFAHETGEWMIISKYNYRAVYEELRKGE